MNFLHYIAALLFIIQVCAGLLIGAAPAVPVVPAPVVAPAVPVVPAPVVAPAVPVVPAPVAAPAVAAPVIPAVRTVHTGLPVEVRNTMLTSDKEIGHFSGTMHRSSDFGFPFAKKN